MNEPIHTVPPRSPAGDGPPSAVTRETIAPVRDSTRAMQSILLVVMVLLVGGAAALLGWVLEPFVFAILLFFLFQPIADRLARFHVPRWLSHMVLLVVGIALILGVGAIVTGNLGSLRERNEDYRQVVRSLANTISPNLASVLNQSLRDAASALTPSVAWTVYGVVEFVTMMAFYLLFIVFSVRTLPGRVRQAFPHRADRILDVSDKISNRMQVYLGVKTGISLGLGVTAAVILALLGVDYWPLWGFLFFLLNYVTYIGSIVACVPPIILAFLQFDLVYGLFVTAVVIAIRLVWIDYLEIRVTGQELHTDSVLLLLGLAFWGYFWGVAGLVLAVPMITSLRLVLGAIDETRPWAILMRQD